MWNIYPIFLLIFFRFVNHQNHWRSIGAREYEICTPTVRANMLAQSCNSASQLERARIRRRIESFRNKFELRCPGCGCAAGWAAIKPAFRTVESTTQASRICTLADSETISPVLARSESGRVRHISAGGHAAPERVPPCVAVHAVFTGENDKKLPHLGHRCQETTDFA